MTASRYKRNANQFVRGGFALGVVLVVLEICIRAGMGWLGPVILLGVVAVVELYRRLQRQRGAN